MGIVKVNEVLKTTDYDIFKFMEGNRNVSDLHLSRIKKSLSQRQLEIPLIVTEAMEIFEGQHRFTACKDLGLPIFYIVVPELTLTDAIVVNTIHKKWTAEDYFQHYLTLGKEQYILLKNFMCVTGLSLHNARTFLDSGSAKGVSQQNAFQNGNFYINDYNYSLELFNLHLDFENCPAFNKASCKLAIIKILKHEHYDHDRMLAKLDQLAYRVTPRATVTDYLQLFTEIYNYNSNKDKKVYFHLD